MAPRRSNHRRSTDIEHELTELANDLHQLLQNVVTLREQCSSDCEPHLPGLAEARDQIDSLVWQTASVLFWSNYSIKSDSVA